MQIPPEDSLFSLPIWRTSRDAKASRVQMNAASAYQRGSSMKTQSLAVGLGMVIVLLVVITGGSASLKGKQTVDVQASFDMKRSLTGTVTNVVKNTNSFTLDFESSPDTNIQDARKSSWTIQLPPGVQFSRLSLANLNVCFSISDIRDSLTSVVSGDCENLIMTGRKALIEYVVINTKSSSIIAKTIIVEMSK